MHDRFKKVAAGQPPEALQQLKEKLDEAVPIERDRLAALLRHALVAAEAEPEPELPAVDEQRRLATAID